ncbi:MAG TPA: hypothetical protein PK079_17495 [Leptospiraceae bacterium]|nr:hypothetical protein [Leptospiraceae bacterium]HMW06456.1 hypothetical protein [Leptospiraceae bacterium]HMX32442.1 hypothetical protein [Leptospiraceae bacterium]HMY33685.1 hypothetical protein [Leptospiraceae bacterium]HMZ65236.1 hypothetical protein [Leptospiraceae bacterium]
MKLNKTIFLILIFPICLSASDFIPAKIWFSNKLEFTNGFEFIQLFIQQDRFILAKLNYNKIRKWEELRIIGTIKTNSENEIDFYPEMCSVFATKKLGLRWILIQGFDCDHLNIKFTKNRQEISICPSIGILENYTIKSDSKPSENSISAIVVSKEENISQAWSLQMRYIKKGSNGLYKNIPFQVLETVDSTGSFVSSEFIPIGELIQISNPKQTGFFD